MRKKNGILPRACLLAVLAALWAAAIQAAEGAMAAGFASEPKGIILRGEAAGVEPIRSIKFVPSRNVFILNDGEAFFPNPVDPATFRELLDALSRHDHLGVSIRFDRTFFTYGELPISSRAANDMAAADKLLGGVLFAMRNFIGRTRLPGNYVPKAVSAEERRTLSVGTFYFDNYVFRLDEQRVYRLDSFGFHVDMVPVRRDRRAPDGGYVTDKEAAARGDMEPADRENLDHILAHQREYVAMPEVDRVARIGEAAAFIRSLRGGKVDKGKVSGGNTALLKELAEAMR